MKCLIVLALVAVAHAAPQYLTSIAIPTVLADGHLADTPEVALAKAAHFTHHANAVAATSIPPIATRIVAAAAPSIVASPFYRSDVGPFAIPTVLADGHLADTPEVAAAKIVHLAEHAKALSQSLF